MGQRGRTILKKTPSADTGTKIEFPRITCCENDSLRNFLRGLGANLASRWEGVRLPRASGKSPHFPGSCPKFPRKFPGDFIEVLALWNLTALQSCKSGRQGQKSNLLLCPMCFGEGAKGLCGHRSKRLVALAQHGVARAQTLFAQAQDLWETLGPSVQKIFCTPQDNFQSFVLIRPLSMAIWFALQRFPRNSQTSPEAPRTSPEVSPFLWEA